MLKSKHPLYPTYKAMLHRCNDPKVKNYHNYGGRGISVCERWSNDFWAFVADVGDRPEGMTLDRIDNDGNYEPDNTRWSTLSQQAYNSRPSLQSQSRIKPFFIDSDRRFAAIFTDGVWRVYDHNDYRILAPTVPDFIQQVRAAYQSVSHEQFKLVIPSGVGLLVYEEPTNLLKARDLVKDYPELVAAIDRVIHETNETTA